MIEMLSKMTTDIMETILVESVIKGYESIH